MRKFIFQLYKNLCSFLYSNSSLFQAVKMCFVRSIIFYEKLVAQTIWKYHKRYLKMRKIVEVSLKL